MCVLDIPKKVLDVLNNLCLLTQDMLMNFGPPFTKIDRSSGFFTIIEAVSHARHRKNKARSFGKWLDLLAQLGHVDVKTMRPGMHLSSPEIF